MTVLSPCDYVPLPEAPTNLTVLPGENNFWISFDDTALRANNQTNYKLNTTFYELHYSIAGSSTINKIKLYYDTGFGAGYPNPYIDTPDGTGGHFIYEPINQTSSGWVQKFSSVDYDFGTKSSDEAFFPPGTTPNNPIFKPGINYNFTLYRITRNDTYCHKSYKYIEKYSGPSNTVSCMCWSKPTTMRNLTFNVSNKTSNTFTANFRWSAPNGSIVSSGYPLGFQSMKYRVSFHKSGTGPQWTIYSTFDAFNPVTKIWNNSITIPNITYDSYDLFSIVFRFTTLYTPVYNNGVIISLPYPDDDYTGDKRIYRYYPPSLNSNRTAIIGGPQYKQSFLYYPNSPDLNLPYPI